jgi:hypothetical protein
MARLAVAALLLGGEGRTATKGECTMVGILLARPRTCVHSTSKVWSSTCHKVRRYCSKRYSMPL